MQYHTYSRRRYVTTVGLTGLALAGTGVATAEREQRNFRAHLAGENEVPSVDTDARGQALFRVSRGDDALEYRVLVANIDDVVAAHIHCAPEGVNGPVGVTLFSGGPTSDSGVLAEGTITTPDDENGCGWMDLDDVLEAMRGGDTYVNVHTLSHPSGEIRGQIN